MNDYIIVIRIYVTEWMDQIHIHYSVDDNLDIKMMGVFEGQTHGVAERQTLALWLQFPKGPQEMMSGTTIL